VIASMNAITIDWLSSSKFGSARLTSQNRADRSGLVPDMPLNPTNENLEWMESFTGDAGYPCHWRGLDFVDGLAAKYQDVIEYYLGDGRDKQCSLNVTAC
jgi:hypothetical protein